MIKYTLKELADLLGAQLHGDPDLEVTGPASLGEATAGEISFLAQPRYASLLTSTKATAVVVAADLEVEREDIALLRAADPNKAFTKVVQAFAPEAANTETGVHPTAFVHDSADVQAGAYVGPLCSVAAGAKIATGARLLAQVAVGENATVGADTVVHPGVVIYHDVQVGARCLL
ncbi:MAG: UDP-3-O-[3-hydroxymyristoyl] glucosamine N-acyltransferase, partial [Gammaproteobacteria bacterium]